MRILGFLDYVPYRAIAKRFTVAGASTALSLSLVFAFIAYAVHVQIKREKTTMALAENIYHEGRGELVGNQYLLGLITLARTADDDPQWPKDLRDTIAQKYAFSWVLDHSLATKRDEQVKWKTAVQVARDLIDGLGSAYLMPKGWECVRYYKRTDNKGVSEKSRKWFEKHLVPVATFGSHTAYREKKGCVTPMRTTA